jgi:hypothetical protein
MKVKFTQTSAKYFFITNVADTVLTLYGGTDYTVANAAISAISFSNVKAPLNFPMDPAKWTVLVTDSTQRTQAGAANGTWYNLGTQTIAIPIGSWIIDYHVNSYVADAAVVNCALSTANNSATFTQTIRTHDSVANAQSETCREPLVLATATTYYFNTMTTSVASPTIYNLNERGAGLIIKAICAYL